MKKISKFDIWMNGYKFQIKTSEGKKYSKVKV